MLLLVAAFAVLMLAACGNTTTTTTSSSSPAVSSATSAVPTEAEVAALYDRWNKSLQTGDPQKVVDNYAETSILLPTLSNQVRITREEKANYFEHFLADGPSGKIVSRQIQVSPEMAVDTGLYTFTFAKTGKEAKARYSFTYRKIGNEWLIISHHSSLMPEK